MKGVWNSIFFCGSLQEVNSNFIWIWLWSISGLT
jgi:hypothetical protein